MGIRDDLRDLLRSRPCLAADEIEKLAEVLLNQVKSWEGRKNDGRDDPSDGGDDDQRHYKCHIGALLRRKGVVDDVRQGEGERWGVVGLPIRHVDVAPSLVLIREGPARGEVRRNPRNSPFLHRGRYALVLEEEEEQPCKESSENLLHTSQNAIFEHHLARLWHERYKAQGDDPLHAKDAPKTGELLQVEIGQRDKDKQSDI
mmetsp:Transcript_109332/g.273878  ORF Transcript_109332/g.273878 Transcript_109332/m.273878 type:complete len:202 (-) Transcript_109332:233-838(-)